MELRHLRYFLAVAESLHFGRAAQHLHIAQPSLSHQIRQLESELQTKLFERSKKRVTLTESGQLFLEESRLILEHADRAALAARTGKRGETGQVRVGFDYWIDWTNSARPSGISIRPIQRFTFNCSACHPRSKLPPCTKHG